MKKAVDDETVSKLSFFSYVGSLEPYLRKYQCDKPVIVFMFKDLRKVFLSLLRIIVKVSVMTGKTVQQLRETDKDENLLPLKDMDLGFARGIAQRTTEERRDNSKGSERFQGGGKNGCCGNIEETD